MSDEMKPSVGSFLPAQEIERWLAWAGDSGDCTSDFHLNRHRIQEFSLQPADAPRLRGRREPS